MFDNVKIRRTELTEQLGFADMHGVVYGMTTPSHTGVTVIGSLDGDVALNVSIENLSNDLWFHPDLVELIDHAPGTRIDIGDTHKVRDENGDWHDATD